MVRAMTTEFQDSSAVPASDGRKLVVGWLALVAVLVFAMIVLGGVTRLTNSGLSMTEWKPITGWLPPLSHEAWIAEFERYKAFPEYQKINKGMSLSEFQGIYAFEFAHRVLGRIIGIAFFVPFVLLLLMKKIPRQMAPRLALLFVLGAAQGAFGGVARRVLRSLVPAGRCRVLADPGAGEWIALRDATLEDGLWRRSCGGDAKLRQVVVHGGLRLVRSCPSLQLGTPACALSAHRCTHVVLALS